MLFDLFYELSVPDPTIRSESQVFHDTLDELAFADTLGFNTAWLVEHHFMQGYSHSASPELFLAAASQRTRKLRLGHAIIPLPYHHPVHVAERLATLDILSNGRLEFGFGRGFSPKEYRAFGASMAESRTITKEGLDIIRASFSGEPVTFHGKHFQLDDLNILPKTVQKPHPPIWAAAVSPDSFDMAAYEGLSVLIGPFKPWFMIKEDIKRFQKQWSDAHQHSPGIAMTIGMYCLEDGARARRESKHAFEWFYQNLLAQTKPVLEKLYDSYEYYKRMGSLHAIMSKAINLKILETMGMVIVGNPDECAKKLRAIEKRGVTRVICAIGAGALPTASVKESMQTIAQHLIPQFQPAPVTRERDQRENA